MIGRAAVLAVAALVAACAQAPSQGATTARAAPPIADVPIATESALGSYLAGSLAFYSGSLWYAGRLWDRAEGIIS